MIVLANPNRNIVGKQQKGWKRSCFGTGQYSLGGQDSLWPGDFRRVFDSAAQKLISLSRTGKHRHRTVSHFPSSLNIYLKKILSNNLILRGSLI